MLKVHLPCKCVWEGIILEFGGSFLSLVSCKLCLMKEGVHPVVKSVCGWWWMVVGAH